MTLVGEIPQGRVIPIGRLREPMDAAARAQVLVVSDATAGAAATEAWSLGISQACGAQRTLAAPVLVGSRESGAASRPRSGAVFAVAAIANPERFVEALRVAGWQVADRLTFADHHRYTSTEIERIAGALKQSGADVVFTTDKDAVRFEAMGELPFALYRVPLVVTFDPAEALFESVRAIL